MHLVDTHCHIQSAGLLKGEHSTREQWAKAPNLGAEQIIANAAAAGVSKLICVGCDLADSQLAVAFAGRHDSAWASIGIHPHEAKRALEESMLPSFSKLTQQPRVVAIGECGLDYFYEHSPRAEQAEVLRYQLDLAVNNGLPVIFHVREAFDEFWPIFDSYEGKIRGVLHSFTDSTDNLARAVERGLYVGVNGIATFTKQAKQLDMYQAIPLRNLVLETDAPFLTPVPFRGKINEPKQIATVAAYLAELRGETIDELTQATTTNAEALFAV